MIRNGSIIEIVIRLGPNCFEDTFGNEIKIKIGVEQLIFVEIRITSKIIGIRATVEIVI